MYVGSGSKRLMCVQSKNISARHSRLHGATGLPTKSIVAEKQSTVAGQKFSRKKMMFRQWPEKSIYKQLERRCRNLA